MSAASDPPAPVVAFVSLGSNLGPREAIFEQALRLLEAQPAVRVTGRSSWIRSEPMGPDQPPFRNGVVRLETTLGPEVLLALLRAVERTCGRAPRAPRWGPRVLDLDLVLYGDRRIRRARLQVPHPGLSRPFVAGPLGELDPGAARDAARDAARGCTASRPRVV